MDRDVALNKLDARRERRQRAREFLAKQSALVESFTSILKSNGSTTEPSLFMEFKDFDKAINGCAVLWAMWSLGKLRRKEFANHPSGEKCYTYTLNAP
jgi:hypothetical protein